MADTPKENEAKYMRFLNALKTLAPNKTFNGITLADFTAQVEKSAAPRKRLIELEDEKKSAEADRDKEDLTTSKMCEKIKNAVISDDDFGDDSALYEAFGFVKRSDRKSGLTRKKNGPEKK